MDIPLWKQELLKRKQAKLSHEKSVSPQNSNEFSSKARLSSAVNNEKVLNHRLNESETKADLDFGTQNAFDKVKSNGMYNAKKGGIYEGNIVISGSVDKSDTRQKSGYLKGRIVSTDIRPSRLDSFNESPKRSTEKYNTTSVSGSCKYLGMQENARGQFNRESSEKSSKTTVNDCDKDTGNDSGIAEGVEREHISPRDLKKMWELQATKGETLPKGHVVKSSESAKKISKGFQPSREVTSTQGNAFNRGNPPTQRNTPTQRNAPSKVNTPTQVNTQVSSNPTPASVPKAYKSPYAKKQWNRPASVSDEKSVKSHEVPSSAKKQASPARVSLSNGGVTEDTKRENGEDGVEHIQSVKSLLGLFGGKAKPGINRKVSDTAVFGNKSTRETDFHTLESKSHASKRPGLFKHHSEPNLFFPVDKEIPKSTPTSPKKSPTAETDKVPLPSHHVSQGIQARMTRLRRASSSSMEEMDGYIEFQNRLNSEQGDVHDPGKNESLGTSRLNQKQSPRQKDTVIEKGFSNRKGHGSQQESQRQNAQLKLNSPEDHLWVDNNKQSSMGKALSRDNHTSLPVKTSMDDRIEENAKSTTVKNENEKSRLSGNDKLSSPVNNVNTFRSHKDSIHDYALKDKKCLTIEPDLSDTKEHKSENKYQSKQSNYVVDDSQSHTGLQNHVVTKQCLTEINQNKQETKPVIKNEEGVKEIIEKSHQKPRKRGLNIVDPLAVLELTKDPILLKEKPETAKLGVFKDSSTGKVKIIKHEPDKKDQIAKINRTWDLDDHLSPSKQNNGRQNMPAPGVQILHVPSKNVPVSSIDEIPVSVIDDFDSNKSTKDGETKVGHAAFYNGTSSSASGEIDVELAESDEEFIPVSSIDSEVDLGPPPEIVFDKMPANLKSSFAQTGKV